MSVRTRISRVPGVLTLGVVLVLAAVATGYAQSPDPHAGATQPTREQNLDANGYIAVHEQGTADVNVTNSELDVALTNEELDVNVTNGALPVSGTVNVGNFGDFTPPAVTQLAIGPSLVPLAGETQAATFPTVNATAIHVFSNDDEYYLSFQSPLSPNGDLIRIFNPAGDPVAYSQTFTYPVPINGYSILCDNEEHQCIVDVTVVGFAP